MALWVFCVGFGESLFCCLDFKSIILTVPQKVAFTLENWTVMTIRKAR
jgi:hypothetical protein